MKSCLLLLVSITLQSLFSPGLNPCKNGDFEWQCQGPQRKRIERQVYLKMISVWSPWSAMVGYHTITYTLHIFGSCCLNTNPTMYGWVPYYDTSYTPIMYYAWYPSIDRLDTIHTIQNLPYPTQASGSM